MAWRRNRDPQCPSRFTGRVRDGHTLRFAVWQAFSTASCSIVDVMMCGGAVCAGRRVHSQEWLSHLEPITPKMAWLSDSVPPLVKTISWGLAPMRRQLVRGRIRRRSGRAGRAVDGGGVGEVGGEIRKHGVEDRGFDGRRGVVIEINAGHVVHISILRATAEGLSLTNHLLSCT